MHSVATREQYITMLVQNISSYCLYMKVKQFKCLKSGTLEVSGLFLGKKKQKLSLQVVKLKNALLLNDLIRGDSAFLLIKPSCNSRFISWPVEEISSLLKDMLALCFHTELNHSSSTRLFKQTHACVASTIFVLLSLIKLKLLFKKKSF